MLQTLNTVHLMWGNFSCDSAQRVQPILENNRSSRSSSAASESADLVSVAVVRLFVVVATSAHVVSRYSVCVCSHGLCQGRVRHVQRAREGAHEHLCDSVASTAFAYVCRQAMSVGVSVC